MSAVFFCQCKCLQIDPVLIKIGLHPRVYDQFFQRIFLIYGKQTLPFRWVLFSDPCLDGDPERTFFKNLFQKMIQLVRHRKKSGAASSCRHRARRAAKVQVDRIVPVLPQNLCNRQKIFCAVRKYLRNDRHSRIVFRADVIFLPVSKLFIRHKRRKIAFDPAVIFCVCIPVDISGDTFHGCHIILYLFQLSSPSVRNLSLILIQLFPPVK